MKEFDFETTNLGRTLVVLLITIICFFLLFFVECRFSINVYVAILSALLIAIFIFRLARKFAVQICKSTLSDTQIEVSYDDKRFDFKFTDLISYKFVESKNGPVFYLKDKEHSIRIEANNNFCNDSSMRNFCQEAADILENYRNNSNQVIDNFPSIFKSFGMLLFLITCSFSYLFIFFIEPKGIRFSLAIGGSLFLFAFWIQYLTINNKKNGS